MNVRRLLPIFQRPAQHIAARWSARPFPAGHPRCAGDEPASAGLLDDRSPGQEPSPADRCATRCVLPRRLPSLPLRRSSSATPFVVPSPTLMPKHPGLRPLRRASRHRFRSAAPLSEGAERVAALPRGRAVVRHRLLQPQANPQFPLPLFRGACPRLVGRRLLPRCLSARKVFLLASRALARSAVAAGDISALSLASQEAEAVSRSPKPSIGRPFRRQEDFALLVAAALAALSSLRFRSLAQPH